jgi:choline/ethanolamine kinase
MRSKGMPELIACKMAEFHWNANIPKSAFLGSEKQLPKGGSNDKKWPQSSALANIRKCLKTLQATHFATAKLNALVDEIGGEVAAFLAWMADEKNAPVSDIVFGHNDIQYGNVMLNESAPEEKKIYLIDFEYSAYVPRGYDIGNHWCEWAADYHSETPHKLDYRHKYPTKTQQCDFCRAYLTAVARQKQESGGQTESAKESDGSVETKAGVTEKEVDALVTEANTWALASHAYWAM